MDFAIPEISLSSSGLRSKEFKWWSFCLFNQTVGFVIFFLTLNLHVISERDVKGSFPVTDSCRKPRTHMRTNTQLLTDCFARFWHEGDTSPAESGVTLTENTKHTHSHIPTPNLPAHILSLVWFQELCHQLAHVGCFLCVCLCACVSRGVHGLVQRNS